MKESNGKRKRVEIYDDFLNCVFCGIRRVGADYYGESLHTNDSEELKKIIYDLGMFNEEVGSEFHNINLRSESLYLSSNEAKELLKSYQYLIEKYPEFNSSFHFNPELIAELKSYI